MAINCINKIGYAKIGQMIRLSVQFFAVLIINGYNRV